jgi:hypothetical protein
MSNKSGQDDLGLLVETPAISTDESPFKRIRLIELGDGESFIISTAQYPYVVLAGTSLH